MFYTKYVVFIRVDDGLPGLWLAETFSALSLQPFNGILRNSTGSKYFWPLSCIFFRADASINVANGTNAHVCSMSALYQRKVILTILGIYSLSGPNGGQKYM